MALNRAALPLTLIGGLTLAASGCDYTDSTGATASAVQQASSRKAKSAWQSSTLRTSSSTKLSARSTAAFKPVHSSFVPVLEPGGKQPSSDPEPQPARIASGVNLGVTIPRNVGIGSVLGNQTKLPPLEVCRATVANCERESWRESSCGRRALADVDADGLNGCDRAYANAFEDATAALPADGRGSQVPFEYDEAFQSLGLDSHFDGLVQQLRVSARTDGDSPIDAVLEAWDDNGVEVRSCGEYVYEKYYDYLEWLRQAARFGPDHRAVANHALSSGILVNELRTLEGGRAPSFQWSSVGRPKNEIFGYPRKGDLEYPNLIFGHPGERSREGHEEKYIWDDPSLWRRAKARAPGYPAPNASFHVRMMRALRSKTNEEFERAAHVQQEFRELMDVRAALMRSADRALANSGCHMREEGIGAFGPGMGGVPGGGRPINFVDPACVRRESRRLDDYWYERIHAIDLLIEETLQDASELGCLDARNPTVCDWRPGELAAALRSQFSGGMRDDFHRCVQLTGGDFSGASLIGGRFRDIDWRRGTALIESFFEEAEAELERVAEYTTTHEGDLALGETASDFAILGDRTAGVRMDYAAGWAISGFAGDERTLCHADAAFWASFSAGSNFSPDLEDEEGRPTEAPSPEDADRFTPGYDEGEKPNLISLLARITSHSETENLELDWDLDVFGNDIWQGNADIPVEITAVSEKASVGIHTARMPSDVEDVGAGDGDVERAADDDGGDLGERLETAESYYTGEEERPDAGDSGDFDWRRRQTLLEVNGFITIWGPIRVTLAAGIAAEMGFKFELLAGAYRPSDCDAVTGADPALGLYLGGRLAPFAKASAYAAAALDVWLVQAGVRVNLNLIDAELPFTGRVIVGLGEGAAGERELGLRVDAGLDFKMELLSGDIVLFVKSVVDDIIPGMPLQMTVFSWEGFKEEFPIIDSDDLYFSLALADDVL